MQNERETDKQEEWKRKRERAIEKETSRKRKRDVHLGLYLATT